METLPLEMVLKISGYLTPQDIAHCCGVCHDWREIFNDDCHWRPHCDQELAEHLRNTPRVVEPVFVTPEATNKTLTPISFWRLAFMRENHLWENWKKGNQKMHSEIEIDYYVIQKDFLTNTLVVMWYLNRIEIWDMSAIPMVFVSETDPSVNLAGSCYRFVFGSSMLLVEQMSWIKVFHVDALNKQVELRYNIPLTEVRRSDGVDLKVELERLRFVKENIYVRVNPSLSSLEIIDLETGVIIKNVPCPTMENGNAGSTIYEIKGFPTSDIVIVMVCVSVEPFCLQYHCYDLRQLTFLQSPEVKYKKDYVNYFAIHEHYLAFVDGLAVKIYNVHTLELVYNKTYIAARIRPYVFNNSFIFLVKPKKSGIFGQSNDHECLIEKFSLADRKMSTILILPRIADMSLEVINNKILHVFATRYCVPHTVEMWVASGQTLKPIGFPVYFPDSVNRSYIFNQSFTRALFKLCINEYWW